ncbi:ketoacyl-ACP synthase III [candidate division WOR-3 bacterium]|uniref:Beta-ketoacyl-[acyl-carrier-protein] synthase III n=1 Tax=candidate division WOR-3 bacterium TaxID=2052148 RepID=A0A937XK31_UNCW3|nr:ketoacyl-ACP synthase III [candidate division WOR-3 bacterium]
MSAIIAGTGAHVPARVMTNADLEKIVDTSDAWITERTGMKERHIAAAGETASDVAMVACEKALAESKVKAEELDLIVVGTVTGDMPFPSTACVLQERLGASRAAAFDVSAGCTGFIYALSVAQQFVANGVYRTVLVVGVELMSKVTDWTDRSTCVLFGDGAGAAVLKAGKDTDTGILGTYLAANGHGGQHLYMPAGGSRHPASVETVQQRMHTCKMNGNAVFKVAVRNMADAVKHLLQETGLGIDDLALLIPHQANLRIIEATAKLLKFPSERVFVNIAKYGNTSSATTIIALDEARKAGLVHPGDNVMLVAFGAGLTWGGVLIRF